MRNSGAVAVVEGCGANGCEYMTGGTVVILGPVGGNFAAGMTGGMAYVYDRSGRFAPQVNVETVIVQRLNSAHWRGQLRALISEHARETGSAQAEMLLRDFDRTCGDFWQICPKEMVSRLAQPLNDMTAEPDPALAG